MTLLEEIEHELVKKKEFSYKIILSSYYHYLAKEIVEKSNKVIGTSKTKIICSGGGAFNKFLMKLISKYSLEQNSTF